MSKSCGRIIVRRDEKFTKKGGPENRKIKKIHILHSHPKKMKAMTFINQDENCSKIGIYLGKKGMS